MAAIFVANGQGLIDVIIPSHNADPAASKNPSFRLLQKSLCFGCHIVTEFLLVARILPDLIRFFHLTSLPSFTKTILTIWCRSGNH
jgi:hypothetical protein